MPGWDSLQTVTAAHGTFQLVGLILLVIAATLAGFVAYQLRNGVWPEWLDVGAYQLRSRFFCDWLRRRVGAALRHRNRGLGLWPSPGFIDGCRGTGRRRSNQAPDR